MTLCYLNIYVLMPLFVYKRKYWTYTFLVITSLIVMLYVKYFLYYYLVNTNVWPEGPEVIESITFNYAMDMMIGELYVITFATAIKLTFDWIKENKRLADLEKLQLETELRFLRTQVSPHFFFNTLNNIYSLALEKSPKAPKTILKLSELMRYLLYQTKEKRQSLVNEVVCIQNYLDLERIRYGDSLVVNMDISGDIRNKSIAPMLLLSFIENAFKHGADKNVEDIEINIEFKIIEDFLYFRVSNPIPSDTSKKKIKKEIGGIGIPNAKKRLALGYEEDEYELSIKDEGQLYVVELKLKV
ncbi:sensor histidine kinase [Sediminicola luteus]|nr:sensor histidine kinase [Sediminicola luteus]